MSLTFPSSFLLFWVDNHGVAKGHEQNLVEIVEADERGSQGLVNVGVALGANRRPGIAVRQRASAPGHAVQASGALLQLNGFGTKRKMMCRWRKTAR